MSEEIKEVDKSPTVSVIVPVYKAEKYLGKCVDSILAQTFKDFEVLLVDDGSPDKSGEICDEYARKDPRVRVFHKENGGVSSARQCGLDNARGEYTIHADPDDWVEPNMLEELYAKAKAEDADMVICDYYMNSSRGQRYVRQQPSALDHETVLRELFQRLHGSLWNKLVRRACYTSRGIRLPNLDLCEDLYTIISLLKDAIRVAYCPMAFYHYEQDANPNTLSRKSGIAFVQQLDEVYAQFDPLLSGTDYWKDYIAGKKAHDAYSVLLFNCISEQEYRKRFAALSAYPATDFQSWCARTALRRYRVISWLVRGRGALSRLYHRMTQR